MSCSSASQKETTDLLLLLLVLLLHQPAVCDALRSAETYRVVQKIGTPFLYALTLPNINRFSKSFHCQNQDTICNNTIAKDPTTPQVCRYTTL